MSLSTPLRWLLALVLSAVASAAMAREAVHFTSLDGTINLTAYLSRPPNTSQGTPPDDTPRPALVLLSINDNSIGRPKGLAQEFRAAVSFYPGACCVLAFLKARLD